MVLSINSSIYQYIDVLACPSCHIAIGSAVSGSASLPRTFVCEECKCEIYMKPGVLGEKSLFNLAQVSDFTNNRKLKLKNFNKLYFWIVTWLSPVYPQVYFDLKRKKLKQLARGSSKRVNLGSGAFSIDSECLDIDIHEYPNVDFIAQGHRLPFIDGSIDGIYNIAVLEHVLDPKLVVTEMHRVLKNNGFAYCFVPFMQGFHASPHDYQRYTEQGLRHLFSDFSNLEISSAGSTGSLLWIMQEWIASIFSFGNKKLHFILVSFVMVATFPLKYLDFILRRNSLSSNIASGYIVLAKK